MPESKLYRYQLRNVNHEGWAVFLVDSLGMLAVASDFGNYVHHWPVIGWSQGSADDFRKFIIECDASYIIRKLGQGRQVIQPEATVKNIRKVVLDLRRNQSLTAVDARYEWDLIDRSCFDHEVGFSEWYEATKLVETYELASYGPEPQLVGFMERVWPRFIGLLKAELVDEALTGAASILAAEDSRILHHLEEESRRLEAEVIRGLQVPKELLQDHPLHDFEKARKAEVVQLVEQAVNDVLKK